MFKLIMLFVLLMAVLLTGCGQGTFTGSGNVAAQEEAISGKEVRIFIRLSVSYLTIIFRQINLRGAC